MTETPSTIDIAPTPGGKAWLAGAGVGMEVREKLAEMEAELAANKQDPLPFEQRLAFFWLYVGTEAPARGITEETMPSYIAGVGTQALERHNQFVLEFSIDGMYDPYEEPDPNQPDPLGERIAHVLRGVRENLQDMSLGDTEGGVFRSNTLIGKWEVHL